MQPGAVYAATTKGVFYLPEGAAAWVDRTAGLGTLQVLAVAVDPHSPAHLFAATSAGVYRSTDSGASWGPSASGIADPYVVTVAVGGMLGSVLLPFAGHARHAGDRRPLLAVGRDQQQRARLLGDEHSSIGQERHRPG